MPYPHTFSPSTVVIVDDARGGTPYACNAQIFKPMLGCSFNGPQPLIVGHSLPNMAATILRALVLVPSASALDIKPGPGYWATGFIPSMVLSEDLNSEKWYWHDAVPWTHSSGKLWSVFASKDAPASPPPPPPPLPPVPILFGASAGSATPISLATEYFGNLAAGASGYAYMNLATGVGYTVYTDAPSPASTTEDSYGGDHTLIPIHESGPNVGVGSYPVAGGSHVGPDAIFKFTNPTLATITVYFKVTSP